MWATTRAPAGRKVFWEWGEYDQGSVDGHTGSIVCYPCYTRSRYAGTAWGALWNNLVDHINAAAATLAAGLECVPIITTPRQQMDVGLAPAEQYRWTQTLVLCLAELGVRRFLVFNAANGDPRFYPDPGAHDAEDRALVEIMAGADALVTGRPPIRDLPEIPFDAERMTVGRWTFVARDFPTPLSGVRAFEEAMARRAAEAQRPDTQTETRGAGTPVGATP
jgi:hypothetical protein